MHLNLKRCLSTWSLFWLTPHLLPRKETAQMLTRCWILIREREREKSSCFSLRIRLVFLMHRCSFSTFIPSNLCWTPPKIWLPNFDTLQLLLPNTNGSFSYKRITKVCYRDEIQASSNINIPISSCSNENQTS